MDRNEIIAAIRECEPQLRGLGVEWLSLFGSFARGQAHRTSDVDIVVKLDDRNAGLDRIARLDAIQDLLADILGRDIDVVEEPTRPTSKLRRELDRDAVRAF